MEEDILALPEPEEIKRPKRRRLMIGLLVSLALVLAIGIGILESRHREWMSHVRAIELRGGSVDGYSRAPVWLQRFRSHGFYYLGDSPPTIGPKWLRRILPVDPLLKYCDTITQVELGYYRGLRVQSQFTGENVATLDEPSIDEAILRHLHSFPNIERLNLVGTDVEDSHLKTIANLTTLKWLSLDYTSISDSGLRHVSNLTNLEELLLCDTKITSVGMRNLKNLIRLRRLDVVGTNVTSEGLASVGNLKKLEVLDLHNTNVDDTGMRHLRELRKLAFLDLSATAVTDRKLTEISGLDQLRYLELPFSQVTPDGSARLKGLKNIRQLRLGSWDLMKIKLETVIADIKKDAEKEDDASTKDFFETTLSLRLGHYYEDILRDLYDPGFRSHLGSSPSRGSSVGSGGGFF